MSTTQPIRNKDELMALRNYYLNDHCNIRNYAMLCMGFNSALRISDLLTLRWRDVYCFEREELKTHITLQERKTGKETSIAINENAAKGLQMFKTILPVIKPDDYIFYGRKKGTHLSRCQAYRIIKNAAEALDIKEEHVGCHSMRKTFGYYAWKSGAHPSVLMEIYNHSSYAITKRYLGIGQDDKDSVFLKVNL